jgi:RNA polymerase sigma factor (sigma-70 family)
MATEVINSKVQFENFHKELIEKCKYGDQKAQFQIYKLYYKAMYNTSLRIVNNPMEAEDIMQESFLTAFEKINTFPGTASFGAWLKEIVINRSIDSIKKQRKVIFEYIDSFQMEVNISIDDPTPDSKTDLKVNEAMEAIKRLPDGFRIILSLHLLEGYNHQEISEILSVSPVTSRSQFSRAKQMILRELSGN